MEYSTNNLERWPSGTEFRKLSQSLAVLALCQEDPERYSFVQTAAPGISVFSLNNGEGDEATLVFSPAGTLFRGFAHESAAANWDGVPEKVQGELPPAMQKLFATYLEGENASFVAWQAGDTGSWEMTSLFLESVEEVEDDEDEAPDGSTHILEYFPFDAAEFIKWEGKYYDKDFPIDAVKAIYAHQPLSQELIHKINPTCGLSLSDPQWAQTGYPLAK